MYKRLWWKEARQLWPIGAVIILGALAVQWVELKYFSPWARHGVLAALALVWAAVYAIVAGAAAFAGERETGTLQLLDNLPVSRPVIWSGKVSFAVLTTLLLGGLLLAMAAAYTDRWNTDHFGPDGPLTTGLAVCAGLVVPMVLTWGLFWSAILSNALSAVIAAVASTSICHILIIGIYLYISTIFKTHGVAQVLDKSYSYAIGELGVILATLVASNLIFTGFGRLARLPFQLQSPIVLAPRNGKRSERVLPQTVVSMTPAITTVSRPALGIAQGVILDQSPRRSWRLEASALRWATRQQGATIWVLLAVIGLLVPLAFDWMNSDLDPSLLFVVDIVIALVAGISVCGMENRGRTQRFLTHHGARPGLVWLVKLLIWGLGLALIWIPQAVMVYRLYTIAETQAYRYNFYQLILLLPTFFAIALLCGMAIARGLTAFVIALLMSIVVLVPQMLLIAGHLLPVSGLAVIPLGLLAVSGAWSGDWQLDRPAPGRWLRLGSLVGVMLTALFSLYVGFRAWSVDEIGPIAPPRAWNSGPLDLLESDVDPRNRDSIALDRQLVQSLKLQYPGLDLNADALALVRRAVAQPKSFGKSLTGDLARITLADARRRLGQNDLVGSWNDIINVLRMSRRLSTEAAITPMRDALRIEREALDLAMEWAVAPQQISEQLRSALVAIHELPPMLTADEVLRGEANLTENTINLPTSELKDVLQSVINGPHPEQTGFWPATLVDWLTTPWERERARRVNRLYATQAIRIAGVEPWRRSQLQAQLDISFHDTLTTTPLARMVIPNGAPLLADEDRNEAGRRALVQIIAIRIWQLGHKGQFPDTLEKLVPEQLAGLPLDPYSGRNFEYISSTGQPFAPLGQVLSGTQLAPGNKAQTTGYWLLYSIGPDKRDPVIGTNARRLDRGVVEIPTQSQVLVFPIPPVKANSVPGDKKP